MELKYFMHRIKKDNGVFDKGIEVHDTLDSAKGSFYAYVGAYAFGRGNKQDHVVDYVQCRITDVFGNDVVPMVTWIAPVVEPEPEPEEEPEA